MSTEPADVELICTEHVPPVVVQVCGAAATKVAPAVLLSSENVTVVPSGAGPKPVTASPGAPAGRPSSWLTVAVIVCALFTPLVAVSRSEERRVGKECRLAWALSPERPSPVARVSEIPPTENVVVAWMATERADVELICTEHVPPVVVQVCGAAATKVAPAVLLSSENVTVVPSGAGPKSVTASPGAPAGRPSSWLTVAVIVCALFTPLVAVSGDSTIRASTYSLLAFALSPESPSPVARVSEIPPTENVVVAWMSTEPADVELICTEHVPPVVVQVCGAAATKVAPAVLLSSENVTVVPSGAGPKPVTASPGAPAGRPSSWLTVAVIV